MIGAAPPAPRQRPGSQHHKALERAAQAAGYRIAPKVRVADVLPIENSGLSNAEYSYALRSHFDWVVTEGEDRDPQFAVEFDGTRTRRPPSPRATR